MVSTTRVPSRQWLHSLASSASRPRASTSQLRFTTGAAVPASSAIHTRTCNFSYRSSTSTPQRFAKPQQIRWHSAPASKSRVYHFDDVKAIVEKPSEDRILIDVREPAEYSAGYIPSAINIPINSAPEALFLSSDEFEDRFGFEKPDKEKEVVFYCKAGVRSSAAAKFAEQCGYERIGEYRGSWLDWVKSGGKEQKP